MTSRGNHCRSIRQSGAIQGPHPTTEDCLANDTARFYRLWPVWRIDIRLPSRQLNPGLERRSQQYCCLYFLHTNPRSITSHSQFQPPSERLDWSCRYSTMQSPVPFFRSFRYIHMQHHRFTNHPSKDPDLCWQGPLWQLPFRWVSLDLNYLFFYLRPSVFLQRPKSERMDLYGAVFFGMAVLATVTIAGWLEYYLLLFFASTPYHSAVFGHRI